MGRFGQWGIKPRSRFFIFVPAAALSWSCSKDSKKGDPGKSLPEAPPPQVPTPFACKNPGEKPITKREDSQAAMKFILGGGSVGGETEPSKLKWNTGSKDGKLTIEIGSEIYRTKYDEASGRILLKKDLEAQGEDGELSTFSLTTKEASDASHCTTAGFRFKVKIEDNEEKGSNIAPIM